MKAAQMYNEFEIAYEAIASGDAPGYEPYEVSILLTEAQDSIIKSLIATGVEYDDSKALVLGPFIETDTYSSFGISNLYPSTFTIEVDQTPYWGIINERLRQTVSADTVEVKPIDHASFAANLNNPFKKPDGTRYYWRLIQKGAVNASWLIYGPSTLETYFINYLEKPSPIIVPGIDVGEIIDGTTVTSSISSMGLDCKFNSLIHRDIIKKAAQLGKTFIGDPQGVQLLNQS